MTVSVLGLLVLWGLCGTLNAATLASPSIYSLADEPQRGSFHPAARYDGQKVVRISNPSRTLRNAVSSAGIDIWGTGRQHMDVRVSDLAVLESLSASIQEKIDFQVTADNVQKLLDSSANELNTLSGGNGGKDDWFSAYHTYAEIVAFLTNTCKTYASICKTIPSIGKTHEGRDIVAFRLGKSSSEKPQIYIQGTQHAREWAASTTAQYIFHQLLTTYGSGSNTTHLLDRAEVLVVPLANPDGYTYTWTSDRLWRKNRRNNGRSIYGVDLNRNWGYDWGLGGSSTNPRSEVYMGPSAESEPETKALINFFRQNTRIVGAIDFHTFSQLLLRPWGGKNDDAPHESQLRTVTENMRDIISSVSGSAYTAEKSIELYVNTGTASDWFYTIKNTLNEQTVYPYGITIELRPSGGFGGSGFILPPDQILPTGQEILPAFLYYANNAIDNPLTETNADSIIH